MTIQQIFDAAIKDHQANRLAPAVEGYRRVLAAQTDSPDVYFYLASALQAMGKLDEAIAAYRQAIALRPDFAQAYNSAGTALRDRGLLNDAMEAFRRAIQLDPERSSPQYNLG